MKKVLFLLIFMIPIAAFSQYTGNKLPSGLTVSTTVDSADYTIIQKNGENIVKAIRMDTLKAFFSDAIIESIVPLDSVSGSTGQFIISDGSGWLAPVSAKYEGNDAYTFGQRLSGTVGSGSIVLGRGRATGARSIAIAGITASGTDAVAINGSFATGDFTVAIAGSNVSGDNSVGINFSTVTADYSMALNGGSCAADSSVAIMGGVSKYKLSTAIGAYATTNARHGIAIGHGVISNSYGETAIGSWNDTISGTAETWVATERLLVVGNGADSGNRSNALVMLKNGNTTFSGNITADTITGYIRTMSSFGELWVADGAVGQSIANGTTYVKMTGFVRRGEYENMTVDTTNDKITITETGYYLVNISVSSISGTNGVVTRTAAFLNNAEVDKIHAMQTISNTASPNPVSCSGIIKVTTVPVDLDVRRRHDNGAPVTFTMVYGNLSCHKIAEL